MVINCSVLTVLWNEHTLKGSSKIGRSFFFRHMGYLWQEMGILMQKKGLKLPFVFIFLSESYSFSVKLS